jgi:Spy/CpxP family protein refolding chaperone
MSLGELRDVRRQIHEALFADTPDGTQISTPSTRLKQIRDTLLTARIQAQQQIAKVPTPDQRNSASRCASEAPVR